MSAAVLCLMGPTAVGKTDVAMTVAQALPVEIVSVDSAMVYRGLDIGAGKPDATSLARVPHHLLDIRDPSDAYCAADFARDCEAVVRCILARGRFPLLVGGTGLYFRAFLDGLSALPAADARVRVRLQREASEHGLQAMHQRLAQVDAVAAKRIHATDPQRILRALEVYELTGRNLTGLLAERRRAHCKWPVVRIALLPSNRLWLHRRIQARFLTMIESGLIEEVERLTQRPGFHPSLPAARAVGYRQVLSFLDGTWSEAQMIERAIIATRQLARRQLTWLRREHFDAHVDACTEDVVGATEACLASALGRFG